MLTGLTPWARRALFALKQEARAGHGWGMDDDLTPMQQQQHKERRPRMEALRQKGKKTAWRGADIVWLDTDKWVWETFPST